MIVVINPKLPKLVSDIFPTIALYNAKNITYNACMVLAKPGDVARLQDLYCEATDK